MLITEEYDRGNGWREVVGTEEFDVPRTVLYRGVRRWWRRLRGKPLVYYHPTETERLTYRASAMVKGGPIAIELAIPEGEAWPEMTISRPSGVERRQIAMAQVACMGKLP